MYRILKLAFILLSFKTNAQIKAPQLSELIDSAIKKDYKLDNRELDVALAQLDKEKLTNEYLPRVNISGSDAFVLNSISLKTKEIKVPELNIDLSEMRNRFTSTANLAIVNTESSMLLYSGGKIPLLKKSLDQKIIGQKHLTEQARQGIISEVIDAYDQLALLKQVSLVLNESKKRLAEHMRIADKSFNYGLITKYERQKIEVAQAQVASRIEDYEGKRTIVLQNLSLLTSIAVERIALIDNSLPLVQNISDNNNGVSNRPELRALEAFIIAQDFKVKAEKKWFIPRIQTIASLNYLGLFYGHLESSEPIANGNKLSTQLPALHISPMFAIGVGFSWNVFDGKVGKNSVAKASLERLQTENARNDVRKDLELNLTKCKSDYAVSITQVALMQKQHETASNALTQASKEYRTGLIRTSELIDAEEDFENASLGLIQARYNQRRAAIELLKATGDLKPQSIKQ